MADASNGGWRLPLPIAVVVTLALQLGGAVWWASDTSARLRAAETRLERVEQKLDLLMARVRWASRPPNGHPGQQ